MAGKAEIFRWSKYVTVFGTDVIGRVRQINPRRWPYDEQRAPSRARGGADSKQRAD